MAPGELGGGIPDAAVTAGEIYREQLRQGARLEVLAEQLKALPDHEQRIRALERWRYGLPVATLLAIASAAVAVASWAGH